MLFYHQIFRKSLPNLERLDLRTADAEYERYVIPILGTLFAGALFRLKELKYSQGNWWSDRGVRSRTWTRAKLVSVKMSWSHPHLPKRTSGALEQQQTCQVADDQRV